jgi:type IV secretion system protein VirB11
MSEDAAMLDLALAPARAQLEHPDTEELCFNGPGEAWWLRTGRAFERVPMPAMTYRRLHGIATLAAAQTRQTVGPRAPLMGTDLPAGHRLQAVLPPAVPHGTICLTFRRPSDEVFSIEEIGQRYDLSRWNGWKHRRERRRAASAELLALFDAGDLPGFLRALAVNRSTPLFCGPTGAGKSAFLKTCLPLLPLDARVVVLEDAREAVIPQPNHVRLLYSAGGLSGGATLTELMTASLRLRPTFVVLQEMRDPVAAWTFMMEVISGHPGSPTTIHGRSAPEAAKRLFNLMKGSPEGAAIQDETLISMLATAVDVIVPISNDGGLRTIDEVWFRDDAERRGETFAHLLREI